ncbi:DUF1848 domain-containing protein [Candidatus Aminicenantes bacterium AC-334-K16]|jgi:hypothetical protein|nr:DUF1848 domain-containing protein [Candidatus Aminicenantes bacterium AC-334-K16]
MQQRRVISASRRTDLVAFFSDWLEEVIKDRKVRVIGPSSHVYEVRLHPEEIHTFVLWSKDFANILNKQNRLFYLFQDYDQIYCHFTITGLGGTEIEPHVLPPEKALEQLEPLVEWVGDPRRVSLRFDPIVYWREGGEVKTNLYYFEKLAPRLQRFGLKTVRFSFVQWYRKAQRRAMKHHFSFVDPSDEEKLEATKYLLEVATQWNLHLYPCCQPLLTQKLGLPPSACIDGILLETLHPRKLPTSTRKDKTQRRDCYCTESVDIGSYTQHCPHACVYCYANPLL